MGNAVPFGRRQRPARKRSHYRQRTNRPRHLAYLAIVVAAIAIALFSGRRHDAAAPRPRPNETPIAFANVTAIDGDTLRADGRRIRLSGIDAPEMHQTCRDAQGREWPCGQEAKQQLAGLIARGKVVCAGSGDDRYGRLLAICSADGTADLGEAMVRAGFAVDYRRYTEDYLAAERQARADGRGIWRGRFEWPEDWRHHRSSHDRKMS